MGLLCQKILCFYSSAWGFSTAKGLVGSSVMSAKWQYIYTSVSAAFTFRYLLFINVVEKMNLFSRDLFFLLILLLNVEVLEVRNSEEIRESRAVG